MPLSPVGGKIDTDLPSGAWEADYPACRHAMTVGPRQPQDMRTVYSIFSGGLLAPGWGVAGVRRSSETAGAN